MSDIFVVSRESADKHDNVWRVRSDGSHFIASYSARKGNNKGGRERSAFEKFCAAVFLVSLQLRLKGLDQRAYMHKMIKDEFNYTDEELFVKVPEIIKKQQANMKARRKRFVDKANMNEFNYFVTLTYDDKKHDEASFVKTLKKCLGNLHTRRGWRYMGVFERGTNGRLHFHGLFYIPRGEMPATISGADFHTRNSYNVEDHKLVKANESAFFLEVFGRNDFEEIIDDRNSPAYKSSINYILKYIGKNELPIFYSRGIFDYVNVVMKTHDYFVSDMENSFCVKKVLFDDFIQDFPRIYNYRYQHV